MKSARFLLLFLSVLVSIPVFSQSTQDVLSKRNLELSGGWVHVTGDNGTDGFDVGAALWFSKRVSIAFNYDYARDNSALGAFALTSVGLVTVNSKLQNWLVGPRVFFPSVKVTRIHLDPFAEFQVGGTHLSQRLNSVSTGSTSASDTAFSWMLGGGVDYVLSPHWAARGNIDFLRTHLISSGQSRLRFVLGVDYTFRRRK